MTNDPRNVRTKQYLATYITRLSRPMPEQLQRAIDDYHALIARDLNAAEEQLDALRQIQIEQKVTFGDRPLADSLRPTFLTEATYNTVQDTVYLIRQAILSSQRPSSTTSAS